MRNYYRFDSGPFTSVPSSYATWSAQNTTAPLYMGAALSEILQTLINKEVTV
jgi:hypothetical protein